MGLLAFIIIGVGAGLWEGCLMRGKKPTPSMAALFGAVGAVAE